MRDCGIYDADECTAGKCHLSYQDSSRCFPSPTSFSQVVAASLLPLPSLKLSLLPFSHFLLSSSRCFPSPTPFLLSSSRCFPSPTSFSQVLKFLSSFCPPFYCSTVLTIFVIFSLKHLKCKQRPFFPTPIATTLTVLATDCSSVAICSQLTHKTKPIVTVIHGYPVIVTLCA